MSYGNDDAHLFGALPGLSSHAPQNKSHISSPPGSFTSSQKLNQPSNTQTSTSRGPEYNPNFQPHHFNAQAYSSSLPGLSTPYAQPWAAQQPADAFPLPTLYNIAHANSGESQLQSGADYSQVHTNPSTGPSQSEGADTSEEMEEGELSDSDSDFEPDPLPEHPPDAQSVAHVYQTNTGATPSVKEANASFATNGRNHMTQDDTQSFSPAYLLQQRYAAKDFIRYSGFTYHQLAQEGFNTSMLQSLFQELGISTQPDAQLQSSASSLPLPAKTVSTPASSNTSQPPKPANREEYLARLKALQKKPLAASASDKQASTIPASMTITEAEVADVALPNPAKQATSGDARLPSKATFAIRIRGTTDENKARNMFQKADRAKIRRIHKVGTELALHFDSIGEMRTALEHLPFHYKQPDKGKLYACELKDGPIDVASIPDPCSVVPIESKLSSENADANASQANNSDEDAAVRLRKEKLARLREEALKSAKAAQAKKELAAARAGAWLENFSSETAPTSSSATPVPVPVTLKRPATSELANSSTSPSVKRPFGQPRYEDEQDDCIIEASEDEAMSDTDKPSFNPGLQPLTSTLTTPKAAQSRDGLEAHELKIMEMRRKILELEQRNKAKAGSSSNSTPAPDAQTTTATASGPSTPVPLPTASTLAARDKTPIPTGVSPLDWKKQRRTQIQSTLPAYNAKVASAANKLALLKKQMEELEESMQQEERERQQLLQELENLGMDTETMPDMPIEELKATRDDLNAQLEGNTTQARILDSQTHPTAEPEVRMATITNSEPQTAGPRAENSISPSSGTTSATSSAEADATNAMDISESESNISDNYEPPEMPSVAPLETHEAEGIVVDDDIAKDTSELSEAPQASLRKSFEGPSSAYVSDDKEGSRIATSGDSAALFHTARAGPGYNLRVSDTMPVVVSSDSEGDSLYGDTADDGGPEPDRGDQEADANDFNMSSTDDDGSPGVYVTQQPSGTHSGPGSAMETDSEANSSSGDASMEESESEDDYEPPEVPVPPEQPAATSRNPADSSFSKSGDSSSENHREHADADADADAENEEDEPYEPPEAEHDPTSADIALDSLDDTPDQSNTNHPLFAANEQTSHQYPTSGGFDVGTVAQSIMCANVGQESLPKTADSYKPYESPLKIFRSYRQNSDLQKEIPAGIAHQTFGHSIDSNTPLCPFESAGGVCNDPKCNGQHFRTMNLSGESF